MVSSVVFNFAASFGDGSSSGFAVALLAGDVLWDRRWVLFVFGSNRNRESSDGSEFVLWVVLEVVQNSYELKPHLRTSGPTVWVCYAGRRNCQAVGPLNHLKMVNPALRNLRFLRLG